MFLKTSREDLPVMDSSDSTRNKMLKMLSNVWMVLLSMVEKSLLLTATTEETKTDLEKFVETFFFGFFASASRKF